MASIVQLTKEGTGYPKIQELRRRLPERRPNYILYRTKASEVWENRKSHKKHKGVTTRSWESIDKDRTSGRWKRIEESGTSKKLRDHQKNETNKPLRDQTHGPCTGGQIIKPVARWP